MFFFPFSNGVNLSQGFLLLTTISLIIRHYIDLKNHRIVYAEYSNLVDWQTYQDKYCSYPLIMISFNDLGNEIYLDKMNKLAIGQFNIMDDSDFYKLLKEIYIKDADHTTQILLLDKLKELHISIKKKY